MLTKTIAFLALLPLICITSHSQFVTVQTVEPQKSSFKTLGTGLNLDTYYDEDNIRYYQFHDVVVSLDGYYKVGINNNSGYQKKKNLSVHVIQLDKALQITREFDIDLKSQQNSAHVTPFALYRNGNKIELLANNKKEGMLNILNWEFNVADFSVARQENILASIPIAENSYCDFLYDVNEKSLFGGISFVERKGKKSKECSIHSLSWNNNMKLISQQSTGLNISYEANILSKVKTTTSGETWSLLDSRSRNISTGTFIYFMGGKKEKLTEIIKDNQPLAGASIGLDSAGSGIFVAGFLAHGASSGNEGLSLIHLDKEGTLISRSEYRIPESFIAKTTNPDNNAGDRKGLNKNYFVREVLVRQNNTIDVVSTYISLEENLIPSGPYTKTRIGDVIIHSFLADKLVSSICFNRNIRDKQNGEFLLTVMKDFSIPFIYTQQDDLVMLCVANSSTFSGGNNSKMQDQYISEAQFVAVKIDNQFRVKKQVVFDLSERIKGFDTFTGITLRKIEAGQFFGYHETEFGMTSKAKLTFSHIRVK